MQFGAVIQISFLYLLRKNKRLVLLVLLANIGTLGPFSRPARRNRNFLRDTVRREPGTHMRRVGQGARGRGGNREAGHVGQAAAGRSDVGRGEEVRRGAHLLGEGGRAVAEAAVRAEVDAEAVAADAALGGLGDVGLGVAQAGRAPAGR